MKQFTGFFLLLLMQLSLVNAQKLAPDTYWIQFTDKAGTPYEIGNPAEFLSQRAIERRDEQNIPITETDLPVSPIYLDSLQKLGMDIIHTSKWLNAAVVQSFDSLLVDTIESYGFVSNYHERIQSFTNWFIDPGIPEIPYSLHQINLSTDSLYNYGESANQIQMMNGDLLHNMNYRGQDMLVAVLDAGFYKVNELPAFDSLRDENRLVDTWDFVRDDSLSYKGGTHGMKVLSTMAGNMPGQLIGTAPKASYCIYRTENASSEYLIEEANWVAAAEKADSIGADLINTSLGYSDFDDPDMSHTYQDMNGRSTLISTAADIAVSKGMAVVSSAGNEGISSWTYITAPADARHVISVGAVASNGAPISFSSKGPSSDGRIKPDVAAKGYRATAQSFSGGIGYANGTSFAAPITAGMVACLWQARPELNSLQITKLVRKTSSQHANPDTIRGFGIPDFAQAYYYPNVAFMQDVSFADLLKVYPNPFDKAFSIKMNYSSNKPTVLRLYNLLGVKVKEKRIPAGDLPMQTDQQMDLRTLPEGAYILQLINGTHKYQQKIIKQ